MYPGRASHSNRSGAVRFRFSGILWVFRFLRFDNFPPSIDSPFAPLATTWCSDAETYTRSEPRAAGTAQYVSANRTHMRVARGSMRVRSLPNRRVPGTKN